VLAKQRALTCALLRRMACFKCAGTRTPAPWANWRFLANFYRFLNCSNAGSRVAHKRWLARNVNEHLDETENPDNRIDSIA